MATLQLYCSQADVEAILSAFGLLVRLDDDMDGTADDGLMAAGLNKAAADVNHKLLQRYTVATCLQSEWVKQCAAHLAAEYICKRRGNEVPAELAEEVKRYRDDLALIRQGIDDLTVNDGLATPELDHLPSVSNFVVDQRLKHTKVRKTPSISTGGPPAGGIKTHPMHDFGRLE